MEVPTQTAHALAAIAPLRVLVASECALMRLCLGEILAELGHSVVGAVRHSRELPAWVARQRPDALVCDGDLAPAAQAALGALPWAEQPALVLLGAPTAAPLLPVPQLHLACSWVAHPPTAEAMAAALSAGLASSATTTNYV